MCRALLLLPAVSPSGVGWHSFAWWGKAGTAPAAWCRQGHPQGAGQHRQAAGMGTAARTSGTAHVCSIEQLQLVLPGSFSLMG